MSLFIFDENRSNSSVTDFDNTSTVSESPADTQASKKADLAGPGIGDYAELEKILPQDYHPLLTPKETQKAIFHLQRYIEDNLCKELGLMMVEVPLIVDVESGVNDMLDRDGSRTPIQFHISNDRDKHPIECPGRSGRHQVEARRPQAVQLPPRRRHLHRHARCPQRLLPRSRSLRLRRSMGLGTNHYRRAAQSGVSEIHRAQDLEGPGGRRKIRAGNVPRTPQSSLPQSARRAHVSARRRDCSPCIPTCRASAAKL